MLHPRLSLSLLVLVACASRQPTAPATTPTSSPTTAPSTTPAVAPHDDTAARIDRITGHLLPAVQIAGETASHPLADRMQRYHIPAVSIAVFDDYELLWARGWGHADESTGAGVDEHTLFQAGSISKSVHALAVLLAVADGQLALDRPINDYLVDGWKLPDNELTRATPVTLRHLLSHTAGTTVHGFPGYAAGAPVPTVQQILDGVPPANTPAVRVDLAPGKGFRYSGGGTTISQLVLVEQAKRPYPELLFERVLVPLAMRESSYEQPLPPARLQHAAAGHQRDGSTIAGKRHLYPEMAAAGLWSTPSDLARFFIEVALARAGRSQRIPQAVAMQMTTAVAPLGGTAAIGLGVFLSDRNGVRIFGHGGADEGFQANAFISLEGGRGVVVMANSNNGSRIFPEIERAVFAEYAWPGADPILERFAMPGDERDRFVGRYLDERVPRVVSVVDGKLKIRGFLGDNVDLVPIAADTVVNLETGERLQRAPDGALMLGFGGAAPSRKLVPMPAAARHPLLELDAGRFDAAVALWRAQVRKDRKAARADEQFANGYGYYLLELHPTRGRELMRLISTVFPDSANAHDSLADAHLANKDVALAIGEYQRALATLATDPRITAAERPTLRARLQARIAELQATADKR